MNAEKKTSLLRFCDYCNNRFIIWSNESGKFNNSTFKQRFCCQKCKNAYVRNRSETRIQMHCAICENMFLTHESKAKYRKTCSRKCNNKLKEKNAKVLKIKDCLYCKLTFKGVPSSSFCSRKCQKAFTKIKYPRECITCKKIFYLSKSTSKIQRCSRKCQFKDQSNGKIKIKMNGRTGYRTDIEESPYFKSSFEADFARFLNHVKVSFQYEQYTFITDEGNHYTPDFYLPDFDVYFELKGVKHEERKNNFSFLQTKNLSKLEKVRKKYKHIFNVLYMEDFKKFLMQNNNLWNSIDNLELKNYKGTRKLIKTHENKENKQDLL